MSREQRVTAVRLLRGRRAGDAGRGDNRPGLDALAYRVGTHGQFLETMIARSRGSAGRADCRARRQAGRSPSSSARCAACARAPDDPTLALLDAWARSPTS